MLRAGFKFFCLTLFSLLSVSTFVYGQDLLKSFTIFNRGGKNYVNWTFKESYNQSVKLIGIQRSKDSINYYSTVGHAGIPTKNKNQYIDKKPSAGSTFYRLFFLFKDGSYAFSHPAKIVLSPATLSNSGSHSVAFQPSIFVYTNPDNNVNISIADVKQNDYTIRFYDAANHFLFEISDIQRPLLIVDKTNFLHTGWFHYKLYKNGKIYEEWKFLISDKTH